MVGTEVAAPTRPDVEPLAAGRGGMRADSTHSVLLTSGVLALFVSLVVIANRWGEALLARGVRLQIMTPPLNGKFDWRPGRTAIPALVCGVVVLLVIPRVAMHARVPTLLGFSAIGSLAWAITLALVDGSEALTEPLLRNQYLNSIYQVGDLHAYLSTFTERLPGYNIHTRGHPPGFVVLLWAMDHLGFHGVRWEAALIFAGGAAAVVAVLVVVRDVAGETVARQTAPFLVLAPAAVAWTSGDPFFAGVSAWAVTLMVLATGRTGRRQDALAVASGLLFAWTAFLSYGLVLLMLIPLVIGAWRRSFRPLIVGGVVVVAGTLAVWGGTGFAWWEGLAATRVQYFRGVGGRRPYNYFLLANLAAFALAVGPATAVALARVRRRPLAVLVGAAIAVVLIADVSGMSKAEVERIWLPFVPWVMAAGAVLMTTRWLTRGWLAVQVGFTVLVAVAIRAPW
ncbi:MAG: hypothetical protein ABIP21_01645 [Acidimicrobiia bacterium]